MAVLPLKYWRDGVVSLRAEIQPTAAQIDSGVLAIGDGPQARHSATSHRAIEPGIAGIGKATALRLIGTLQASRSPSIPMLRPLSRRELKGEKATAKSKSSGHYAQAEPRVSPHASVADACLTETAAGGLKDSTRRRGEREGIRITINFRTWTTRAQHAIPLTDLRLAWSRRAPYC